jgi:hypothetical protein
MNTSQKSLWLKKSPSSQSDHNLSSLGITCSAGIPSVFSVIDIAMPTDRYFLDFLEPSLVRLGLTIGTSTEIQ